jgi:hypothetical protein
MEKYHNARLSKKKGMNFGARLVIVELPLS